MNLRLLNILEAAVGRQRGKQMAYLLCKAEGEVAVEDRQRGGDVHLGQRSAGAAACALHKRQKPLWPAFPGLAVCLAALVSSAV